MFKQLATGTTSKEKLIDQFQMNVQSNIGYTNEALFDKIREAKFNERSELVASIDERILPYHAKMLQLVSPEALSRFVSASEAARTKDDDYVIIDDLEGQLVEGLLALEQELLTNENLSDDEKLVIISSTSVITELVPIVIDEVTEYYEEEVAGGRVNALKFLKKVVNAVATIIRSSTEGIVSPLAGVVTVIAVGVAGPWGLVVGAAAGAVVGSFNGIQCVQQNNKACYVCVYGVGSQPCP